MSSGEGAAPAAPTTTERIEAAIEFARLGCRVVPAAGKHPGRLLGDGWQKKATTDESVLRGWFTRWPDANVGIIGDGKVAPVDVDDPDAFGRLQDEHGSAPVTPRYLTGGGPGRERLLFQHPGGRLDTKLATGVQLRTGTLMSTVPPGVHPDTGTAIEWVAPIDEVPLAVMPERWLARVRRIADAPVRPVGEWAKLFAADVGVGDRHPAMASMAGYLVRKLGSGRITLELLLAWNRAHCKPPKDETEIAELVKWAVEKEAGLR